MQLYSIALESGAFDIYDVELSSGTNTVINLSNLIHQNDKKSLCLVMILLVLLVLIQC